MLLNQPRALQAMRHYQLGALIATSPVNVTYFSDYAFWIDPLFKEYMMIPGASSERDQTFAILTKEGSAALILPALNSANVADCWIPNLFTYGGEEDLENIEPASGSSSSVNRFAELFNSPNSPTALGALLHALRDFGLNSGQIGVEMEGLPSRIHARLKDALPKAILKDCTNLIRWLRMVKSQEEIARLRRSAEINETAAMESLALARPGRPMAELSQHYRSQIAAQGADFDHFAFSPRGYGMATEAGYVLEESDVLYTDFGCIYRGYFSDAGATLCLTEMSPTLKTRYRALRDSIEAGAASMRPGVKSSSVQAAMWRAFTDYGFKTGFPHGHGVGLEVRDYPILVPDSNLRICDGCLDVAADLPLESGMVFSLEAGIFAPGVGSLQVEKNYLITAQGSEPLVPQDRTLPVQPA